MSHNSCPLHLSDDTFDGALACPVCGEAYTHVDTVLVAARTEDGAFKHVAVDAVTGYVDTRSAERAPAGPAVGEGRRHRIALRGTCESGHTFSIVFTQHKGWTLVETLERQVIDVVVGK